MGDSLRRSSAVMTLVAKVVPFSSAAQPQQETLEVGPSLLSQSCSNLVRGGDRDD